MTPAVKKLSRQGNVLLPNWHFKRCCFKRSPGCSSLRNLRLHQPVAAASPIATLRRNKRRTRKGSCGTPSRHFLEYDSAYREAVPENFG
jgi:hypothetical protein